MRTIYLYGQPRVVALKAGTQTCPYLVWIILFGLLGLITPLLCFAERTSGAALAGEANFKPIFDGKTLKGWQAPDMSYWLVEDGAITARATQQHPVKKNQFLVWQFGELDDFELKLKYRISGTSSANSGVQIRSRVEKDGHAVGYQADIDLGGRWAGALYDEHGRGMLAARGQKTIIGSDGSKTSTSIANSDSLFANIKKDGWNDYHIIARGAHIVLKINGKVTAEVIDNDKGQRELSGLLALQLHSGPPMTVQFKDIGLKRLKMADRKKIVLVAGPGSHRYGSHEHNAGCLLLGKLLNENMPKVYAAVYTDGWPKDPTAFDNTDAIAIYCDGGGRHVVMPHLEEVESLVKKGVGLAFIHYAVTVPKGKGGNCLLDWIGGYYETYWSVNPHWEAEFKKLPKHPITRGVRPFSMNDEWYYHMRFVKNMENVTLILTAIPPDSTRKRRDGAHSGNPHVRARMGMPEHVAWAYESATGGNGGRGFGFTGGHWHWNWAHDDFRKLVLNALVWITGVDVPPDGVPSKTPSVEELEANQDYPKSKSWNREKIQDMIERWNRPSAAGIIYGNPRVYNVDYSFELVPDPNKIDRAKDLKLWVPIPREWDSQKAVKILAIEPAPHATYEDPEHGNKILFWDFGKGQVKESYEVNIKYRLEIFEVHTEIDSNRIGSYDKNSEEYQLYTRNTHNININPKIRELAQSAIREEKNVYLQAKRIFEFVREKMRYKIVAHERGTGTKSLLDFPVTDPKTGEQYFEGQCNHYSVFFVALCRAVGIPARGVNGMVGWGPWIKKEDLTLRSKHQTELTPDGLAATRLYGPMGGHIWAELYLPNYGWIPVDPTWGRFGHQVNKKLIFSKGRDIKIGPYVPQKDSEGYGEQWIPLHNGRVGVTVCGAWNIAKIRVAKAKVLHNSDPFPADSYAEYAEHLYPEIEAEEKLINWRQEVLLSFYNAERGGINKGNIFEIHPRLNSNREAYLCHLLHQIVGDEKFTNIFQSYLDLRLASGRPVSTEKFQEIAERMHGTSLDFLFKQWVDSTALPQFKLDNVMMEKGVNEWRVYGSLLQVGETYYRVPIELVLKTEKGQESQEIWLDSNKTDFEFYTTNQPKKLTVDPDYHIPTIRWMPARLQMLWDFYPNLIVIYGSLAEAEANKTAAERFVDEFARLSHETIKVDANVNEADLKAKCVILFGRPETNKITQRFQDSFPIKFEKDKFTRQGTTYDQPSQGVAQIIENPNDPQSLMIMYAGLSSDATQKICDKSEWRTELEGWFIIDLNASYIIYDKYKKLVSGDWEEEDSDLVWKFDTHPSVQSTPNEQ